MAERVLCESPVLVEGGQALRFTVRVGDAQAPAFAIRYQGRVYAYVNECAHIPVELDLNPGRVFDASGQYLVCSMHGAYFSPHDGLCQGGPCRGDSLQALTVEERDGQIWLREDDDE